MTGGMKDRKGCFSFYNVHFHTFFLAFWGSAGDRTQHAMQSIVHKLFYFLFIIFNNLLRDAHSLGICSNLDEGGTPVGSVSRRRE
jgi:hypothetical protein